MLPCKERVEVPRDCGHGTVSVQCERSAEPYDHCLEQVNYVRRPCLCTVSIQCWQRQELIASADNELKILGKCQESVPFELPCKHSTMVRCWQRTDSREWDQLRMQCNETRRTTHPICGHVIEATCGKPEVCREVIQRSRSCGHPYDVACCDSDKLDAPPCTEPVAPLNGSCPHRQTVPCHQRNNPLTKCRKKGFYPRQTCSHQFQAECGKESNPPPCLFSVEVLLPCNHKFTKECSKELPEKPHCTYCAEEEIARLESQPLLADGDEETIDAQEDESPLRSAKIFKGYNISRKWNLSFRHPMREIGLLKLKSNQKMGTIAEEELFFEVPSDNPLLQHLDEPIQLRSLIQTAPNAKHDGTFRLMPRVPIGQLTGEKRYFLECLLLISGHERHTRGEETNFAQCAELRKRSKAAIADPVDDSVNIFDISRLRVKVLWELACNGERDVCWPRVRPNPTAQVIDLDKRRGVTLQELAPSDPVFSAIENAFVRTEAPRHVADRKYRLVVKKIFFRPTTESDEIFTSYRTEQNKIRFRPPPQTKLLSVETGPSFTGLEFDGVLDASINEVYLFHGSKLDVCKQILIEGFDPRLANNKGMFGRGAYFAENSSKSDFYAAPASKQTPGDLASDAGDCFMLVNRVLLGTYQELNDARNDLVRPEIDPASSNRFDSVLGGTSGKLKFREMIVYDRSCAFPEFLVQYSRQATT